MLLNAPVTQRATYLAETMLDLLQPADSLAPRAQGGFVAELAADGVLHVRGGNAQSTPMQALRTAVAEVWARGTQEGLVSEVRPDGEHARRVLEAWW